MANRDKKTITLAVVGAGAAGLTAAIHAARAGARVVLFERNDRVGKKILVTGNGRCNLTNRSVKEENFHGSPSFAMAAIGRFDRDKTLDFFAGMGIRFQTEEDGRMFPFSQQAGSVLDVLRFEAEKLKIELYTGMYIASMKKENGQFILVTQAGKSFRVDRVVLACGGKADPDLGSDGNGFRLAESLGHRTTALFPSLAQLRLGGGAFKAMERMKWEAEVRALEGSASFASARGDIIFTSYGISGTAVLSVSRKIIEKMTQNRPVHIEIDLLPELGPAETIQELEKRIGDSPDRTLDEFFIGWLNKRIGQTLLKSVGLELTRIAGSLNKREIETVSMAIHGWRFEVSGHNGWQNAQTTAGGITSEEVDPKTMGSKLVDGLFFAGEMLDVDGDSGGYNLQWAWSSGAVAGTFAAGASI